MDRLVLLRSLVIVLTAAMSVAGAMAVTSTNRPEGVPVGPWVIAPHWASGVEYNDNLFYSPGQDSPNLANTERKSDWLHTVTLGLDAQLPIKTSLFNLEYEGEKQKYRVNDFSRDITHELQTKYSINLGPKDSLEIRDRYILGVSDIRTMVEAEAGEGSELAFRGVPYAHNLWEVKVSRRIRSRQGYSIRLSRSDMNFEPADVQESISFFDYRGFDSSFEYLQPMTDKTWLVVYFDSRRFNHYRPEFWNPFSTLSGPGETRIVGVPFRKEESNNLQIGLNGVIGRNQPFALRVGFGRLRLLSPYFATSEFKGIVGQATWRIPVSDKTDIDFRLARRPLPSFYPTYYITTVFQMRTRYRWLGHSNFGLSTTIAKSKYGDPVNEIGELGGNEFREDTRWQVECHAHWFMHDLIGIRVTASHAGRQSTWDNSDYAVNTMTAGITLGWY